MSRRASARPPTASSLTPLRAARIGFGALAADAAKITLAAEPAIKTPDKYTFIGKPQPRVDVPLKINGAAQYAIDTRLPDMVYAAILACPVPGGTLASVDETPLKNAPGIVQIVRLPDAVAVVATDTFWRAKQALAKLHPEWNTGAAGATDSARFNQDYRDAALTGPAATARNDGDVDAALPKASQTMAAVYEVPYLAHATMEPMNATVHLQADRLDVWVGTQSADRTLKAAAGIAGLKPEQVYIHNTFIGGGFGRKSANDEMIQAIQIAKAVNRPVKLVWTREDDIRRDRYRPQAAISFKGALGSDGMPTALHIRTAVGSLLRSLGVNKVENGIEPFAVEGLSNNPYKIANTKVECALKNTHIPVSFWRSVGASQNAFAIESFIDEMAHAGGQDPYKLRRTLLEGKPDWIKVLDTAAEKGDWGKPIAAGRARGIAIHECYGTIVSEVAEITLSPAGALKVDRITLAVDCGHVVNPLTLAEQMEGARHLRADGGALRQGHDQERRAGAGQFRHLSDGAAGAGAEDRRAFRIEWRQQMGRCRRARRGSGGGRGLQRDLRADRQTYPVIADHGPRPVGLGVGKADGQHSVSRHQGRALAASRKIKNTVALPAPGGGKA